MVLIDAWKYLLVWGGCYVDPLTGCSEKIFSSTGINNRAAAIESSLAFTAALKALYVSCFSSFVSIFIPKKQ
jgi:hypothetical protein